MLRILSIDPSGTGTTGMFLRNLEKDGLGRYWPISAYSFQPESNRPYAFLEFQSKDWKKHLNYLKKIVQEWKPDLILYETTNYINSRGSDMTSLLKLLGAIESLPVPRIESLLVSQVKDLKSKLFKGQTSLKDLAFKPGQGWFYQQQKISLHQLDAFLVYWLWHEGAGSFNKGSAKETQNG